MSPTVLDRQRLEDWRTFASLQLAARDIDPLYPVLRHVLDEWYAPPVDPELRVWAVLVYVAYYNAASALTALHELPCWTPPEGDLARLPTGIERRGLRGGANLTRHLDDLVFRSEFHGSFTGWLQEGWTGDPTTDWTRTRENAFAAWGNGRWATYKLAEVLQKVLGWPIAAPDMGMDGASGPKHGLEILFGHASTDVHEERGLWLLEYAHEDAVDIDLAEVETCLCDFHGLVQGRYYVGHDVGLLHDDVHALPEGIARETLLAAAAAELPAHYWRPLDRAKKRVYRDTGVIVAESPTGPAEWRS